MPGYIPKEKLDTYHRWQADSFDAPQPKPVVVETPPQEPAMEGEIVSNFNLPTAEEIEQIHNEAQQTGYQAGYEEGQKAGFQSGLDSVREIAGQITALTDNFRTALAALDQSVADQVLSLALEVARQVLQGVVTTRPEVLLPTIREALAALPIHHGHIMLHLNPADASFVREHLGEQFSQSGSQIVEDKEVQAGGCLLRAGSSEVDASLDVRWKRVLEAIGATPSNWLEGQ